MPDGVAGADGERELELADATVELTPVPDGPLLVDVSAALEAGSRSGGFDVAGASLEDA